MDAVHPRRHRVHLARRMTPLRLFPRYWDANPAPRPVESKCRQRQIQQQIGTGPTCSQGRVDPVLLWMRQMKSSWAPSVISMKSEALMMPSTSSYRSSSVRWFMSALIRQAHR